MHGQSLLLSLRLLRDCLGGGTSDDARLDKLQKRAARIILDSHYLTPSKEMFSKLSWLPLNDWVKYRKATMYSDNGANDLYGNQWQGSVLYKCKV